MTISVSKYASYAVLTSDHGGNTVSASKTVAYAALSSDYGLNTVTASKLHTYAILSYNYGLDTVSVAKFNTYAVLNPMGVESSKLLGYAVLSRKRLEKVSKINTYAVLTSRQRERISKFTGYAVLTQSEIGASKLLSYVVLTNPVKVSKFTGYAVLNSFDDTEIDDPLQPPTHAVAVIPSDTDELPHVTKSFYVGVSGDMKITTLAYEVVILHHLPVGWHSIKVRQIWDTDTSAQEIVAAW